MENMLPDRKLVELLARGPEPGGMYFPKNFEFYWGVSGDWAWRHFCKKEMHWPRWIKISTYSPIQATDCHKWTVILWYLHIVQVQLPWENPAMVSSFTTTRMDEETSGCFILGSNQQQQWAVATKNRKLFIRQSRDTSHLQQRSIEPSASAILKNLNYPGFSSWDDIRYKKNRWGNLFQKVPFLKIHGLFPTLDITRKSGSVRASCLSPNGKHC